MAHCTKCGCSGWRRCGLLPVLWIGVRRRLAQFQMRDARSSRAAAAESQMDEKVAGLLCYVLGWITGMIFYFIDKRPFVRFHAAQSIVVFGGLHVIFASSWAMFFGVQFDRRRIELVFRSAMPSIGLVDLAGIHPVDSADGQGVPGQKIPRADRRRSGGKTLRHSVVSFADFPVRDRRMLRSATSSRTTPL